jgi:cyclic peptide transporter
MILKSLDKKDRVEYILLALLGIVNSMVSSSLLLVINQTLLKEPLVIMPGYNWLAFSILIGLAFTGSRIFQSRIIRLTKRNSNDLMLKTVDKLRHASYEDYEKLGNENVYTAMYDIAVISGIPRSLIVVFSSFFTVVCGLIYMFLTSVTGAGLVVINIAILIYLYLSRNVELKKDLELTRKLDDTYFQHINDLLQGFQEMKMGTKRNDNLYKNHITKNRSDSKALGVKTSIAYLNNELIGNYGWYLLIGIILFLLPLATDINYAQITTFIVTILFLMNPIIGLVNILPTYTTYTIAVERLKGFEIKINSFNHCEKYNPEPSAEDISFEKLEMVDVFYERSDRNGRRNFVLGPVNLKIQRGELVFVTGRNGSGKSTFVNLITGLYKPVAGAIYLNGHKISLDNYPYYRDHISAIFTKNYLFHHNYDGFAIKRSNVLLNEYIDLMQLNDVIHIHPDKNHIDRNLSKGQQKRLALIYAMLEDRPIMVLDEWAAEQDPTFRRYFYHTVLRKLIESGKTIVCVTHDDDFYHLAERIIEMKDGRIASDTVQLQVDLENS